jgi:hypothetical protein
MDHHRRKRKQMQVELQRLLLFLGKAALFMFGYYTLSRGLTNNFLSRFTSTGWKFDWSVLSYLSRPN